MTPEPPIDLTELPCPTCRGRGTVPPYGLSVRQREFYLASIAGKTLSQIAKEFDSTREFVRSVLIKTERLLKEAAESNG